MNTENVGAALRRKLGPLPVWVWAILAGGVLYVLRSRGYLSGLGGSQSGETLQPSQANATPPQEQIPLQPGESVYDPNTGTLSTAPGGDTGGSGGYDPSQAIGDLADAITAGLTAQVSPSPSQPNAHPKTPAHHHKPKKRHDKRTKKGKRGHGTSHKHTTKHPHQPAHHKGHKRSTSKIRNAIGGRIHPRKKKPHPHHPHPHHPTEKRTPTAPRHPGTRQRPTTNTVTHRTPVQHPVSAHSKRPKKGHPVAPGGHRASAPAPRHQRAPAKPPHKPRHKKH